VSDNIGIRKERAVKPKVDNGGAVSFLDHSVKKSFRVDSMGLKLRIDRTLGSTPFGANRRYEGKISGNPAKGARDRCALHGIRV
jgi:hypothetical protein